MAHGGPPATRGDTPGTGDAPDQRTGARLTVDRRLATVTSRRTFAALQLGATISATLGGLVLYAFLLGLHLNSLIAVLAGFAFALVSRRAVTSLAMEWMQTRARHHSNTRPEVPDAPPGL